MKWKQQSFKTKLIVSFSLATLVAFVLMGATSYLFTEKLLKNLIEDKLTAQMEGIETTIRLTFEENEQQQNDLMNRWGPDVLSKLKVDFSATETVEGINQVTQEKVKTTFPSLFYQGEKIQGSATVDHLASTTGSAITFFVKTKEGLLRVSTSVVKDDGQRAVGTFIPNTSPVYQKVISGERYVGRAKVLNKWYMSAYQPIRQGNDVVGAFFMGSPELSSEKLRTHLKKIKIFETGYFFILDSQARFLLHPAKEGESVLKTTDLDGNLIFQKILSQKNGDISYRWMNAQTKQPQDKVAIFRYFPQLDWYVAASFNKAEGEAVLGTLKWTMGLVTLFSVLGMIVMSALYGNSISNQLQKLSEKLLRITNQTTKESEELASNSDQLSSSATEAASSLEETVASLEEINSQVQNNLKMTEETNSLGKKSLETVKVSEAKVKNLSQFMLKIQDDSKRIREISSLIDDIAFQTNLLSLNAAVEAARAGEHGRGFAVVADAVRSLATRSAESAKQITNMITESSERIEAVVAANQEVDSSFHSIVDNIEKLSSLVTEMTRASEEQASGVSQISKAMNQLDMTTQSNSQLAENISSASAQLSSDSHDLRSAVTALNGVILGAGSEASSDASSPSFGSDEKQTHSSTQKDSHAGLKRSA